MASLFFGIPHLAADQAQKHVTVNAAVDALSALAPAVVASATDAAPAAPAEGAAYIVPAGASFLDAAGAALPEGAVAAWLGGAWLGGLAPPGHRVFALDQGRHLIHTGGGTWRAGSVMGAATGAPFGLAVADAEVDLTGPSVTVAGLIPSRAVVVGVTSWVVEEVTGAASFDVGDGSIADRFGGTLGLAAGSSNVGVVGPFATYAPGDVVVTANGADFTGGRLGLAVAALVPEAPL